MATIVEAIKTVLTQYPDGLTSSEYTKKLLKIIYMCSMR